MSQTETTDADTTVPERIDDQLTAEERDLFERLADRYDDDEPLGDVFAAALQSNEEANS